MKLNLIWLYKAFQFIRCDVMDRAKPMAIRESWLGFTGMCRECGGNCYLDEKGVWRHEPRDD